MQLIELNVQARTGSYGRILKNRVTTLRQILEIDDYYFTGSPVTADSVRAAEAKLGAHAPRDHMWKS